MQNYLFNNFSHPNFHTDDSTFYSISGNPNLFTQISKLYLQNKSNKNPDVSLNNSKESSLQTYQSNSNIPNQINHSLTNFINIYANKKYFLSNFNNININSNIDQSNQNLNNNNNISKKTRVPFTKEEDDKIKELVNIYGTRKWIIIASYIDGRTAKQCRDRYLNYLVPGYFNGEWSKEEDELLIKLFEKYGSKWSIIHKFFQDRSANALKNRWKYFLCRINNSPKENVSNNANLKNEKINDSDKVDLMCENVDDFVQNGNKNAAPNFIDEKENDINIFGADDKILENIEWI